MSDAMDWADAVLRAAHALQDAVQAEQRIREASGKPRVDVADLKETVARLERIVRGMLFDVKTMKGRV